MSTYTMTSGPSAPLAHLRALWQRKHHPRTTVRPRPSTGRLVAETGLELLASDHGYTTVTATVTGTMSLVWKTTAAVVRGIGHGITAIARIAAKAVGLASAEAAARHAERIDIAATAVATAWQRTDESVRATGTAVRDALAQPLVRRTTTAAAQAITLWLVLHVITDGALAARVVIAAPWAMGVVAAALNPVVAFGAVLAVGGAALLLALARMAAKPIDNGPEGDPAAAQARRPRESSGTVPAAWRQAKGNGTAQRPEPDLQPVAAQALSELDDAVGQLRVEVRADGSVAVHGIPDTVPPDVGQALAEVAQHEAERHLRRILRIRAVPTRNDRRVVTKAAREAVAAEVRRRGSNGMHSAA